MRRFAELTLTARLIESIRWLCVLPAALLGDLATQFVVGSIVQLVELGWGGPGGSSAPLLTAFLYYVPREAVFVIAGAKTAPRKQTAAAIVLAVLAILSSLMIHVVGQHFAGNRVGFVNYTHFALESAGVLGGASIIFWQDRRRERHSRLNNAPE